MAGFNEDDIRRVREANDIVSVFADSIPMRQRGRTFWCCCPFHEEASPSCQVSPDTQLFYCFGCHVGGDVFSYIMKSEDIDFPDAVRYLAKRGNVEVTESGRDAAARSYKTRLRGVCDETRAFYHTQLMRLKSAEADEARAYLAQRNLGGGVPDRWQLGFAPGRGALMAHLTQAGYTLKEMIDANVVVSYEGRRPADRFFNRIMFPIFDDKGECIAFGGRVVGKGEPKYLNSQETPLFHKSNVLYGLDKAKASMATTGEAIVVEGYTDVICLHEAGVTNVVATLGTALTKQHIRSLSRHASSRIIYLFDGDAAGQRAADRALGFIGEWMTPEAGRNRIDLAAATLPDDLDPADFVAQRGAHELRNQLALAKPLVKYGIDRRIAAHDTSTAEGRASAFSAALSVLAPIKDSVLAKDYAAQIAGMLHLRESDALDALERLEPPVEYGEDRSAPAFEQAAPPQPTLPETEVSRRRFESEFLTLCARNVDIASAHLDNIATVGWHEPLHGAVAEDMLDVLAEDPTVASVDLISSITRKHPSAAGMFARSAQSERNDAAYAAYLAEELTLGDMDDAIAGYRAQLADPHALSEEDADLLFQTVVTLQKDLAARRQVHKLPPI